MTIELVTDKELWDKFVDQSPYGTLFHKWDLLKIIEKHSGYEMRPYGLFKNDTLYAVAPLFFKNIKGVKMVYSPPQGTLAYIPYMGLAMRHDYKTLKQRKREQYLDNAWADLSGELKRIGANIVSITMVPDMYDVRPFMWDGYEIKLLYTYFLDLTQTEEEIWNSFDNDCRQKVRASAKHNLTIKQSMDVDTFFNIMVGRLKGYGNNFFTRQSPEYLRDLLTAFPENIKLYFMYKDQDIVGAAINCCYKDQYTGWFGDATINREIASNEYMNWEFIKMAKAQGYKRLENWGADMKRVNQFKSKFNPTLVPYFHVRKKDRLGAISEWGYDNILASPYLGFVRKTIF
ncbi:lipid II:glycine glycyltransferase FemX [Methanocella arvoryzae]|uniref:BioF2-like acetyltransferase domain-containing protein n=1 Tax=Methanocella arvoryzae (strain DSM 22066 / NBRC 105507 / MRE50) TaxID=351160 RepID=Q0W7B5_METAR|nr:GNAT family N-acetyltransferase [Methanocella arvoryzae]CAH04776.1 hypothetical protein orf11 [uncultured archaeon]CAJ35728.1 conserved hypothetical protein [Methanocella arvoryzae MRE50]